MSIRVERFEITVSKVSLGLQEKIEKKQQYLCFFKLGFNVVRLGLVKKKKFCLTQAALSISVDRSKIPLSEVSWGRNEKIEIKTRFVFFKVKFQINLVMFVKKKCFTVRHSCLFNSSQAIRNNSEKIVIRSTWENRKNNRFVFH